ncbi:hypothetical protein N7454_003846 [Penicillium verhagenii]|nr:hypothetical protein N7454_003846 [Penicillium verhagenii]
MEILVHVSAPSRAQDDARYRAQVAAILNFQSAQQQLLTADTRERPTKQSAVPHPVSLVEQDIPCGPPRSDHLRPATIPLPEWALEPQPIATKIGSGQTAPIDRVRQPAPDLLDSLVSVIPESQPDIYQTTQDSVSSPLFGYLNDPTPGVESNPPSKKRRVESPAQTDYSQSSPNTTTITTAIVLDSPPQPENHDSDHHEDCLNNWIPSPTPSPRDPTPSTPPISTIPFTTHTTPTLSMLTERLKPERTYRPLFQTRALDQLERGYWAMHINVCPENQIAKENNLENEPESVPAPVLESGPQTVIGGSSKETHHHSRDWSVSFFNRFWSFLSDFVGKDARAGWGVWCILEHEPSLAFTPTVASPAVTVDEPIPVLLKVYAWGEVSIHLYLLLFLASERRARKMGLQWRDSNDITVIQMP